MTAARALLVLILASPAVDLAGQESFAAIIRRGDEALAKNEADEAIDAFRSCLERVPRYAACARGLALAHARKDDARAAVEWLTRAADWGGDDVAAILADQKLVSVAGEDPAFAFAVESIQSRFPPSKARPYVRPDRPERGQDLVAMVKGELGSGAAIIVGRDADRLYLATANHVVRQGDVEAKKIEVQLKPLAPRWLRATLLPPIGDPDLDLAVLAIIAPRGDFDFCSLPLGLGGDGAKMRRGDPVYPVGYPGGTLWAMPFDPDRVSQVFPSQISFESQFVRVGFSGGALLNRRGEVTGMIVADEPPLGRAVPLGLILDAMRAGGYPVQLSRPDEHAGALHAAAKAGDAAAVAKLLGNCADPNTADVAGRTPLHEAAAHGSADAVRLLLQAGAHRNVWTVMQEEESGREWGTPLHLAAKRGSGGAVKVLVEGGEAGLETLWRDEDGKLERADTALHVAVRHDGADAAAALIDAGASLEQRGRQKLTPLGVAATHGAARAARVLLQRGASIVARGGSNEPSAMHVAAQAGQVEILKLLVEHGGDVNLNDPESYIATPLHAAAASGHVEAAAYLIAEKALVDAPGYRGATPLHAAAGAGNRAVVELLLANGANMNRATHSNETPLRLAAQHNKDLGPLQALVKAGAEVGYELHGALARGKAEAARILIDGGADLSLRNEDGAQPLHLATERGMVETVELLLKAGARPDDVDSAGMTPLHHAARGHLAIVELLLAAKAPVNVKTSTNDTPLHNATRGGSLAIIDRLLRAGADPNVEVGYRGSETTAVASAATSGTPEILDLLLAAGGDPNRRGPAPESPLTLAAKRREAEPLVKSLLKAGAKVVTEGEKTTPFHAALAGDPAVAARVVAMLLAAGGPVDAKDENGRTPLHEAADQRNVEAVKLLLAAGAAVDAKDPCGQTPLWVTLPGLPMTEGSALAVAELLVAAGADVNVRNTCTEGTLVDLAEKQSYWRVRQLLLSKGAKSARP